MFNLKTATSQSRCIRGHVLPGVAILILLFSIGCSSPEWPTMEDTADEVVMPNLPALPRQYIRKIGQIQFNEISESSGIVASRKYPGVFWTHNDSGDLARIFPIKEDGTVIVSNNSNRPYSGVMIPGARNIDWEDIATDDKGNLIIGAFGNNPNDRKNLGVYVVSEPDPEQSEMAMVGHKWSFNFPDQASYPPPPYNRNFDCEAVFYANGHIYFLTKHRSNRSTKLYRLDNPQPRISNTLRFIGGYNLRGMVTAADVTPDGRVLAILTYRAVWLLVAREEGANWFEGQAFFIPIRAGQCEGIAWDGPNRLLITNEGGEIYELLLSSLRKTIDGEESTEEAESSDENEEDTIMDEER